MLLMMYTCSLIIYLRWSGVFSPMSGAAGQNIGNGNGNNNYGIVNGIGNVSLGSACLTIPCAARSHAQVSVSQVLVGHGGAEGFLLDVKAST